MIVKKYLVNTIEEVQELISKEMGPNAVILTSRQIKHRGWKSLFFGNKVQVVAAVDEGDFRAFNQLKSQGATEQPSSTQESTNYFMQPIEMDKSIENLNAFRNKLTSHFSHNEITSDEPKNAIEGTYLSTMSDALAKILEKNEKSNKKNFQNSPEDVLQKEYYNFLKTKGISAELSRNIAQKIKSETTVSHSELTTHDYSPLAIEIEKYLKCTGDITTNPQPQIMAFVGPPSAGKTTALAKVANHYISENQKSISVISYKDERYGAKEEFSALAKQLDVINFCVSSKEELLETILQSSGSSLILIDTTGFGLAELGPILELTEIFKSIPNLLVNLVVDSNLKESFILKLVTIYSCFPNMGLLFTKLDENEKFGYLLNICYQGGIPLSYITYSSSLHKGISLAEPKLISHGIIQSETFNFAEQLV